MILSMSVTHPGIPCLGEIAAAGRPGLDLIPTSTPACDYAEAAIWKSMGGGWQCLYGCYCQCGLSIEWHEFTCAEPREWSRSFHRDSLELCLNLSGQGRLTQGEVSTLLGPMTTGLYVPEPGRLAAWRLPGEPHRFLTMEFSRGFLERHLRGHELALLPVVRRALQSQRKDEPFAEVGRLSAAGRRRIEALRDPAVDGPARGLWYQAQAMELMVECFFAVPDGRPRASERRKRVAEERVERTIRILRERLAEPPSLADLGREVGCSPFYLSRTFSRELGMTIPQYLRQIRMERAAELLKSGRFNVTEVALEVGYSSLSHFSQAFCQTIGCCPGLYPAARTRRALVSSSPTGGRAIGRQ
jgi:AraC-like DNA-binding protein